MATSPHLPWAPIPRHLSRANPPSSLPLAQFRHPEALTHFIATAMESPAPPRSTEKKHQRRSHPSFIILTVAIGQFSDFFLFGMRVPLLPYLIHAHLPSVPESEVQSRVATLLASCSLALLVVAVPAGWVADFRAWRGRLYLVGLGALFSATVTFYTSRSFDMMVASRVLNGGSAAVVYAAGFSMVADAVRGEDLGKAFGAVRWFFSSRVVEAG